jgi:3-hydroxyisobutyrate dehydrogenase
MVGGPLEAFERCMPLFLVTGKSVAHCGPSGAGQATKACNQILCAANLVGVCEAMALARGEGLDLQNMLAVTMAGAGGSWALSNLGPKIASGDMSPGFMIDLINKDLKIVRRAAEECALPLPGLNLAAELLRAAAKLGHGRDGTQALSRVFEQLGDFNYK